MFPPRLALQRGTVLVLVLLIVALVAALSVKFAAQYQLGLARAEARWHGAQARAFLEGTEEVAKLMFAEVDRDEASDFIGEGWDAEVPIEDDGVSGVAKMTDATAQFNLNDLALPLNLEAQEGQFERYAEPHRRFIRLLQTFPDIPLDQNQAESLLSAVVDWIDQDENESGPAGAEANYYQGMPEPYRPANALFKSIEELRLVRGFNESPELVLRLLPFITVLPVADAGLNVNTLDLVGPSGKGINNLLRCLNEASNLSPLDETAAQQFIAERPETGFNSEAAIKAAFIGGQLDTTLLSGKTRFFWLNASVQLVDQRRSMRSLMMRDSQPGTIKVIQRDDIFELPRVEREDKDKDIGETELVD